MPTPIGNVIREARKALGLTQRQVAAEMKVTRNAVTLWETSDTGPQRDRVQPLAELLGIDAGAALRGELVKLADAEIRIESAPSPKPNARRTGKGTRADPDRLKGPRDVPVYGTGAGGDSGDFRFNGQTIDYAPRPPGIEGRRDVFVVYIVGDSMAPRFEDGDPAYIDPHRRPQPRDYVLVEKAGTSEDEPGDAFVKRLVRRSGGRIYLEQHNPEGPLDFAEAEVKRVFRVIPWTELIGI